MNHYFVESVSSEKHKSLAFKITGEYFLPALTIAQNPGKILDNEIWKIMNKIEFQNRFYYYQGLLSKGYLSNACLLSKFIDIHPQVVKWSKTLSDDKE